MAAGSQPGLPTVVCITDWEKDGRCSQFSLSGFRASPAAFFCVTLSRREYFTTELSPVSSYCSS
ncbi:MAG: hypothetical protein LBS20_11390 [Prevotella sp.]|nr:hypothetical protein [Prevotella sp.]